MWCIVRITIFALVVFKPTTQYNMNATNFGTDWTNIDLNSPYQAALNLLENYTFDTLLLEIHCNVKEINRESVKAQALASIKAKYLESLEILENNLDNITKHAQTERNSK